ncbi:site-specific DNA-methyltransferase [Gramella jeungdoensis]|uniref:site-specific DNA-methyltransferase (adenine-specific) n=1 Tax=Gramella jeungdoensis TaxID=708091 RepID=A0ABT0Z1F7_9FLAO|nr:site-specific DNA-methyltransferase [Gramella jeungdoensis]MCM8569539.1 site-specific DNA-methyltransferase [Gramella jeungdoensis]
MPTLNWIGKDKIVNHHQKVPFKILEKKYTYSKGTETIDGESKNKVIHGDNLEALKSLLPEYEGKVDCIYIDPPYNTGNEGWAYNDNVSHPRLKKWLGEVVGKESEDLTRHDKWLCMMYPRLKLLHKLLSPEGFIFVSLDDNEIHSLKFMLTEIFGEKNFQAEIIVQANKRGQTYKDLAKTHEYLMCFAKSPSAKINGLPGGADLFPYEDSHGRYSIRELRNRNPKFGRFNRPNLYYPIYINKDLPDKHGFCPTSLKKDENFNIEVLPLNSKNEESCWRWGTKKFEDNVVSQNDKSTIFGKPKQDGSWGIYEKYRKGTVKAKTIWTETEFISEQGTTMLNKLGLSQKFQFPKPVELVKRVIQLSTNSNSIVLDSFAGSGSTGQATLELNKQDGGDRSFILIEMEEYANNVTSERIKRVIKGYGSGSKKIEKTDGSFSYYELGKPLFDENGLLNKDIDENEIKKYIWFSETKQKYIQAKEPYHLGCWNSTAYYFYYDKKKQTTLDESFLRSIKIKAEQYIIYADNSLLDKKLMDKYHIVFKKIPRDITRF